MNQTWLKDAERTLVRLIANIMQIPRQGIVKAIAEKGTAVATGSAGASGVLGLIGAFGTASTGTAISTLSGAAASTAKLYWLGSLVGGGVVAGGVLSAGLAVAGGYVGFKLLKSWKGKPRNQESLTDEEAMIVDASLTLVKVFREQLESGDTISSTDARKLHEIAWEPLLSKVQEYSKERAAKTLNFKNCVALGVRVQTMDRLSSELSGLNR